MRVFSRIVVVVLLVVCSSPLLADHFIGECPLTLVASNAPSTSIEASPHGVFRFGTLVFALRGQTLTTYTVNDIGDLLVAREDFVGSMAARESNGGITFSNGYLFLSSEAGLEIFDLRNVRAGGNAPILVSRTAGLHYRRLAVMGNILAGVYPISDYPCYPRLTTFCFNTIDIYNIANLTAPARIGQISSLASGSFVGFNDIAFNQGFLVATGVAGTVVLNINTNPSLPTIVAQDLFQGEFLVTNTTNLLGVGKDGAIKVFNVSTTPGFILVPFAIYNVAPYLTVDRGNAIEFHPQAWFDDPNGRLITMVDEINPLTEKPARTIAFDVFDFTVPMWEGAVERIYEDVSTVTPDEIKYNPVTIGPYVYTIGEQSGLQSWGACNQVTGRIELDSVTQLSCGGAEIHGWVTGTQKIANVELFLDGGALGAASLGGPVRTDIVSRTPVSTFRINVNFDSITRGDHVLRAVGTDSFGNRRQFASLRLFFPGPGQNCTSRRRAIGAR